MKDQIRYVGLLIDTFLNKIRMNLRIKTATNTGFGKIWAEVITMGICNSIGLQLGQKEFYWAFVL
jgi:hypothetical protein